MKKKSRNKHLLKKRRAKIEAMANRKKIAELKLGDLFAFEGLIFEKAGSDVHGYTYCFFAEGPREDREDGLDGKWIASTLLVDIYKGKEVAINS